ncbi:T9SS type A sorting domain-containing protein [bacterium]|nr:T9SS type A sorting domain-containing protein [bacterium]
MNRKYLILMISLSGFSLSLFGETADFIVAKDGSGDFTTIQEAVNAVSENNNSLKIILIRNGIYEEKIRLDTDFIALVGEDRDSTRIQYYEPYVWDSVYVDIGRAVVNIYANDIILANLTVENTQPEVGIHAFAIYGSDNTRTIIIYCNVLSNGGDTVSLWNGETGMYYHNTCFFKGAVDFLCPRGWCYAENIDFYCTRSTTPLWHDGSKNKDQKFVVRNGTFDGAISFDLGRHHHDGAFYLINLVFSENMDDQPIYRPESSEEPYRWGERHYFHNCVRPAGNYDWHKNNMITAEGSPNPEDVTPVWTFDNAWDPEATLPSVLPFAFLPRPDHKQIRVSAETTLSWIPGRNAEGHRIYLGTSPAPDFAAETADPHYKPGLLQPDTDYYWRIDEITDTGIVTGTTWQFHTRVDRLPDKAEAPFPADGAQDVEGPIDRLLWQVDSLSTDFSYLYLGTHTDSLELLSKYSVPGYYQNQLRLGRQYYWRVDVENHLGKVDGDVWQFSLKASPYSKPDYIQNETDGLVSIEVENFTQNHAVADHQWTLITDIAGYSGEGAMQALPDQGTFYIDGYAEKSARLDYAVDFKITGTHYIWIRGLTKGGRDNLFHIGLNGEEIFSASRIGSYQTQNQWEWINGSVVQNPEIRTFEVGLIGIQQVNLWFGRDGAIADKIVLTTNPEYQPSGMGPDMTVQVPNNLKSRNPDNFGLFQNYPNPFNATTRFVYRIPFRSRVRLAVYDILGCQVDQLIDDVQNAGEYTVQFDGANLNSGIYLLRLTSASRALIKRMALVK